MIVLTGLAGQVKPFMVFDELTNEKPRNVSTCTICEQKQKIGKKIVKQLVARKFCCLEYPYHSFSSVVF